MAPDPEPPLPDAAFAPPTVTSVSTPLSLPRKCEGCETPHAGTYGSGRFCSATCAKKVGARHKWAARAATSGTSRRTSGMRRPVADAPCESCSKLHDRSYGSGRFCSVHCARRVAATRKWEKSRTEKSKRLEAIRPAMLASPVLGGKRRRLVDGRLEGLHISEVPMYVQPLPPPSPVLGGYLPPQPMGQVHYQHVGAAHPAHAVEVPLVVPGAYYAHTAPAYRVVGEAPPVAQVVYEGPNPSPSEGGGGVGGSESAARALLCLRATNS